MKKGLLLLAIGFGTVASAQSLTIDDTLSTGDSRAYYPLDSNAVNLSGTTGAGVTWNYSTIAGYNGVTPSTNTVVVASSTAWAADYPISDYCEDFENGVRTFFRNVGTDVLVDGFVYNDGTNEFIVTYDVDELKALSFPMSMGSTYTDPISGTAAIPLVGDVSVTGEATVTADGTGTLTIGTNSYTNVIRVHTDEESSGTFFGQNITLIRRSYVYYDLDDANDMPIFRHDEVIADLDAGGTYGFQAVYSKDQVTNYVGTEEADMTQFSVYPNPATDVLNIVVPEGVTEMTIVNSLGQVVNTYLLPQGTITLNTSDFATGVYLVKAKSSNGITTRKVTIK